MGLLYVIKVFNNALSHIKSSPNIKQLRLDLSDFLNFKSFYNLDEYFNSTEV